MKKIILSGVALLAVLAGFSQSNSTVQNSGDAANLERIRQNQIKNKTVEEVAKPVKSTPVAPDIAAPGVVNPARPVVNKMPAPTGNMQNGSIVTEPTAKPASIQKIENPETKPKPEVVAPKTDGAKSLTNKEALPSAAKGSSVDPDAKVVAPVKQTDTPVVVPTQNSGNTAPAVEKPVKKE